MTWLFRRSGQLTHPSTVTGVIVVCVFHLLLYRVVMVLCETARRLVGATADVAGIVRNVK